MSKSGRVKSGGKTRASGKIKASGRVASGSKKRTKDLDGVPGGSYSMVSLYTPQVSDKELAKIVDVTSEAKAEQAVRQLQHKFRQAESREEQVHVMRATQLAANRANVMSKNKRLKLATRREKQLVAQVYESASDQMQTQLKEKHLTDSSSPMDLSTGSSKSFSKRNVVTRNGELIVSKGSQPYEWQITIPQKAKMVDLTDQRRVIITEKSEVAKVLEELDSGYYVHNLGGNPFGSVERTRVKQNPDGVRRSKKAITFRQDQAFAPFKYPVVAKDAEVVVIADEDFLGQYLSENLAQTLPTKNVQIYNVESTSSALLQEVLQGRHPEYAHNPSKAIAGSWYVESQSEIGATLTSHLVGKGSILDHFTKAQRGSQNWSDYRKGYLQGTQGLNISDQELAVMGKTLQEELSQKTRLKATIQTDLGLQQVEAEAPALTSAVDCLFVPVKTRDLNIKNTDQTIMILIQELGIQSSQAEELVKRLATQGIVSYPRTEYEGISTKEAVTPEDLAATWLYYLPEYQHERSKIIQGIKRIQLSTSELPRSGIIVLTKSEFKDNTIERNTIEAITRANILASLGAYEVEGRLFIVDQNDEKIGETETIIKVITRNPQNIGRVIDVQVHRKEGMSDAEMFEFLFHNELGTTATRTTLVNRLKDWGFLLKTPTGEYKLDDRAKLMALVAMLSDSSLTNAEFSQWLKRERETISANPTLYTERKEELYRRLAQIVIHLNDRAVQKKAETMFQDVAKKTQAATFLSHDLKDDVVQIDESGSFS